MAEITTIEIENGVARYVTRNVRKEVPLETLLPSLVRTAPVTLPSIPRSMVAGFWDESDPSQKTMYMLCELQPAVRAIVKQNRSRQRYQYRLSFPWTYFWFRASTSDPNHSNTFRWSISEGRVYFSRQKYEHIDSPLIVAAIPNLSADGTICWGSTGVNPSQNLAGLIDQRVNEWYGSDFNSDLDSNMRLPYGERNFGRWVRESAENPNSWQQWPEWDSTERRITLRNLFQEHLGNVPTPEKFITNGLIPAVELPYTFGRWEEWWNNSVPQEQRLRAFRALENMIADSPDTAPENEEPEVVTAIDDGGVLLT